MLIKNKGCSECELLLLILLLITTNNSKRVQMVTQHLSRGFIILFLVFFLPALLRTLHVTLFLNTEFHRVLKHVLKTQLLYSSQAKSSTMDNNCHGSHRGILNHISDLPHQIVFPSLWGQGEGKAWLPFHLLVFQEDTFLSGYEFNKKKIKALFSLVGYVTIITIGGCLFQV